MDQRMIPEEGIRSSLECRRAEVLIARAIDGDLDSRERGQLDSHLATCGECREAMAELQALEILLEALAEKKADPPPFLTQKVMSHLPPRMASAWWTVAARPAAIAASLLLAILFGYQGRDLLPQGAPAPLPAQMVHIIFYSPEASSVALVGDFNQWGKKPVTMAHSQDQGMWEFSLSLPPGVYHYNLLVDGVRWAANPKSSTLVPDGFGGYDSVLVVSEKCQNDCT